MASPQPNAIPRAMSRAADPTLPSILTTLPPELRNRIYDFLYQRADPVLIHDSAACRKQIASTSRHTQSQTEDESGPSADRTLSLKGRPLGSCFGHGFNDCMGLLVTCRQIYHEAAGVLYKSNSFLFSCVWEYCDPDSYTPISSALTWIASIGSHVSMVSTILIDADGICLCPCPLAVSMNVSLLQLLRIMWKDSGTRMKISFKHTGRVLEVKPPYSLPRSIQSSPCRTTFLHNLLEALGTQDMLELKRYAKFDRLMNSITVRAVWDDSGQWHRSGRIQRSVPKRKASNRIFSKTFTIKDDGKTVIFDSPSGSMLGRIKSQQLNLYRTIFDLARHSDTPVEFELNKQVASGLPMNLLTVDRASRNAALRCRTPRSGRYSLILSTQDTSTSFDGFHALQRWADVKFFRRLAISSSWTSGSPPCIILNFNLTHRVRFADLRIEVSRMLPLISTRQTRWELMLRQSDDLYITGRHGMYVEQTTTLHRLHCHLYILLSVILLQNPLRARSRLPAIWIDGNGQLLRLEFDVSETITPSRATEYALANADDEKILLEYRDKFDEICKVIGWKHLSARDSTESRSDIMWDSEDCLAWLWHSLKTLCFTAS
ncbi:hypothetical protein FB567DRAFT_593121 [Paraphoma chrysanthemicola]|uniref:DUF7730 domain-containing protein n=1 Tax=Paraphoma chrysanthemicola TaxID=798071 RepID=A0A8K0VXA5_9PLEO|nr:hypothetical protein FB567DRAFT_593121 [Paraphoma chrysanthemicola]